MLICSNQQATTTIILNKAKKQRPEYIEEEAHLEKLSVHNSLNYEWASSLNPYLDREYLLKSNETAASGNRSTPPNLLR